MIIQQYKRDKTRILRFAVDYLLYNKEENIMPIEDENHHNSNQIRQSCGRTRQDLNKMRLGHSYGMFASFGNDEFCTRRRGGCFQIPHLILSPSSKESSMSRQQQLQIKTGKTKLKRICGTTLSRMRGKCSFCGLCVSR